MLIAETEASPKTTNLQECITVAKLDSGFVV